jgi:hypothetical protein
MTEINPIIGSWYRYENGELFEVVAIDEQDGTLEIQYFDGTVEELDFDAWQELEIEAAEPPEDWSGSVWTRKHSSSLPTARTRISTTRSSTSTGRTKTGTVTFLLPTRCVRGSRQ